MQIYCIIKITKENLSTNNVLSRAYNSIDLSRHTIVILICNLFMTADTTRHGHPRIHHLTCNNQRLQLQDAGNLTRSVAFAA